MRKWSVLDWLGIGGLLFGAAVLFLNASLKDAPAVAARLPAFVSSSILAYIPLPLLILGLTLLAISSRRKDRAITKRVEQTNTNRLMPQMLFEPPSEYKLLPVGYVLDLAAQLPYVECVFYAVSFYPKVLAVSHFRLSLRVPEGPTLENIPLRNDDLKIDGHSAPMIFCRRNLTDSELKVIPKRTRRDSASFEMFVRATDPENRTLTYGPVSSMVIDGWLNAPPTGSRQGGTTVA